MQLSRHTGTLQFSALRVPFSNIKRTTPNVPLDVIVKCWQLSYPDVPVAYDPLTDSIVICSQYNSERENEIKQELEGVRTTSALSQEVDEIIARGCKNEMDAYMDQHGYPSYPDLEVLEEIPQILQ